MKKIYFSFFIFLTPFYGEDIEPKYLCSHEKSASRWQTQNSTLNQNQEKIDIKFYEHSKKNLVKQKRERRVIEFPDLGIHMKNWVPNWEHSKVTRKGFELGYYDNVTVPFFENMVVIKTS